MKHKQACIILPLLASLIACSGYQNIYHADDYEVGCATTIKTQSDMALSTVQPMISPRKLSTWMLTSFPIYGIISSHHRYML